MENNQIVVFSTSIRTKINTFKWEKYFSLMPKNIKIRIERFINPKDKYRLLFGRLLLMEGLQYFDLGIELIHEIQYTSHHKPFLQNGIQFNISHSEDIVLCALSTDCEIGIDVEQIREINLDPFYSTLTLGQREALGKASNIYDHFFQLWTLKESVIKAEGLGLSLPLDGIETNFKIAMLNNTLWFVYPIEVDKGYSAYIASDKPVVITQSLKITF